MCSYSAGCALDRPAGYAFYMVDAQITSGEAPPRETLSTWERKEKNKVEKSPAPSGIQTHNFWITRLALSNPCPEP